MGRVQRFPGSLLLSPSVLIALLMLILNDHLGKARWPGFVTGKLSDITGAFVLPVLIASLIELAAWVRGTTYLVKKGTITIICLLTGMGMVFTKTSKIGATTYGSFVGWVRLCVTGSYRPIRVTADPTDLLALAAIGLAWLYCVRRTRLRSTTSGSLSPLRAPRW